MPSRLVAVWHVPLEGHLLDLEELPVYLDGYPVRVVHAKGRFYLVLPVAITGPSYDRVLVVASSFVDLINGAASLLIDSYHPVALANGAFFGADESGSIVITVAQMGTAEERCKASHITAFVGGVPRPDARQGKIARLVEAAQTVAAKDALVLIGRPSPTWTELYLVYELVEANVGGRIYSENWIPRSQGKLFTRTANSYTALGRASRHGKEKFQPPSQPMSQREATQLIRTLVEAWLTQPAGSSAG